MKEQLSLLISKVKPFLKPLKPIAKRHYFLSLIVILGFLIYAVYAVSQMLLSPPTDEAYRQEKTAKGTKTTFDQATIDKIRELKKSDESSNTQLPSGRINPFAE